MATTVALAAALLLAPAAVGCSSDGPDGPSATVATTPTTEAGTTTEPEATTTTAAPTVEEQVEAAYLDIMATYFRRLTRPDRDDPTIDRNHTGASRDQVRAELQRYRDSNQAARLADGRAPVPEIESVAVAGGSAVLQVCIVDDVQLIDLSTDKTVDDDVVSKQFKSTLKRVDAGAWKLESQERIGRWEDGDGCTR